VTKDRWTIFAPLGGLAGGDPTPGSVTRDVSAGVIASLVVLAHCLSFSALIFSGDLASGLPFALWGFLAASVVVTIIAGFATSLPPMLCGPRNPVVAVMAVLATTISAAAFAKGASPSVAVQHVLVALALSTTVAGAFIWMLGVFRLGQAVRFVPFPVIGGFLAASGLLLILGGLQVGMGIRFSQGGLAPLLADSAPLKLIATFAIAACLVILRRWPSGLPAALVAAVVVLHAGLWLFGGASADWFLPSTGSAQGWSPLASVAGIDWMILAAASVEIASIVGVSTVALLLDVSSLEVQRRGHADMDAEFRTIGAANVTVAAIGGLPTGCSLNPSRVIDATGGASRLAGFSGALFLAALLMSGLDATLIVPRPVLGGLLIFLGIGVLQEALRVPGRRSRPEIALTLAIMMAIVAFGYLPGVLLGFVGACLLFAVRYSRIDVVRRHVTRADFAAPVERRPDLARLLSEQGGRIHIFWLSGYLFFGSCNGLFESIRSAAAPRGLFGRRWVILDCSGVTGIDASAVLSLQKLANWAAASDVALVLASASADLRDELTAAGLIGARRAAVSFATRNDALEWCENELVSSAGGAAAARLDFAQWLGREMGADAAGILIDRYLERRTLEAGDVICALGAPADTIELVAQGSVAVIVRGLANAPIRVRRMTVGTVVGEMGFFRKQPRAASVVAEEAAVVYVLSRAAYDRLMAVDAPTGTAFLQFVIRALADRVDGSNREIAALL
jgi:SulP family sulfate permease